MDHKKIRAVGALLLLLVWFHLADFAWFGDRAEYSDTERRGMAQMPELKVETVMDRTFMTDFEEFSLDQFPHRESFRQLKALVQFYAMQQSDKDGLYVQDGYLADMEYKLNETAVKHAANTFGKVYEAVLKDRTDNIYLSVIPDKHSYLSEESGRKALDMAAMEKLLLENAPFATYIDIKDTLSKESYYRTDTHWRQEAIVPTAAALCSGMGAKAPTEDMFTVNQLDRPFYGVYYGQVALPVDPDPLRILENETLKACKVTSLSSGNPKQIGLYNTAELNSERMKDPYNIFLYGFDETCVIIENPNATSGKELILFRDSYGCSMAPLLLEDYARVTVVDLRSFNFRVLPNLERMGMLDLENADVLFLFSSLVLNNPSSFRVG